ncbi:MAG: hypothetical protein FWF05_08290, partial [Oscillospiraceae bacterium]|nr:hypothetical protein [Oscillospiraceae bacterium]
MKKYVSILMVIALVFSLAAVLSACKDDDKGDTATTPTESSSLENNNDDPFFWPTYDQTTDESGSLGSEQPVNAHPYYSTTSRPYYSSESTTSKIGAVTMQTTRAGETTTGRVGSVIVPGTTAPGGWTNPDGTPNPNNPTAPGSTATTKPGETTTAPIIDLNQYENGEVVRPATTQYERYVRNVIASGSYTMKVTASEGGETINMINYHSGMNDEIMAVASMGILQVKLRLIVKNGDYYIVFPTN